MQQLPQHLAVRATATHVQEPTYVAARHNLPIGQRSATGRTAGSGRTATSSERRTRRCPSMRGPVGAKACTVESGAGRMPTSGHKLPTKGRHPSDMSSSRVVAVLGMHRAGTSLVTRGLKSLGIYLGDDFLDAKPDNPTGYWEDRNIVGFNSRVLNVFGLQWKSVVLLNDVQWDEPAIEAIRRNAIEYIQAKFVSHPLWGFKDPRTVRLLPFWNSVFQRVGVEDAYVVVIRDPLSVARSLSKREVDASTSHSLWLLHMVPYLSRIAKKPYVVTDYDLLMEDPSRQLERIASALEIASTDTTSAEIERFVADFVDPELHHNQFAGANCGFVPELSLLVQSAYLGLTRLTTDRIGPDRSRFWLEWKQIEGATQRFFETKYSVPS